MFHNAVSVAGVAGTDRPIILNLPATVEMYSPNVYADVIEWFGRTISSRDSVVLSLHPHNDRGTAVAAARIGRPRRGGPHRGHVVRERRTHRERRRRDPGHEPLLPGDRPDARLQYIERVRKVAEYATRLPVHPRHPYVGDLVYTAFSGSHQDAIKKGMAAIGDQYESWEVPYLPIDPKHLGRTYEAIVRVNSQSGKGGVAYIMDTEHGLDLPRRLQVEFSKAVQSVTEASGTEIRPDEIWRVFSDTYLSDEAGIRLLSSEVASGSEGTTIVAQLVVDGQHRTVQGAGNGPIDALVTGLRDLGLGFEVVDYNEHALTEGSGASAVAYVEVEAAGEHLWGVGMDSSILEASLRAVISAANRVRERSSQS